MLVNDIIEELRGQVDESNVEDLTPDFLLKVLNRGQTKLVRLVSRRANSIFKAESPDLTPTGREITLPSGVFGLMINQVIAIRGDRTYRVDPADLRQLTDWESESPGSGSGVPIYYAQVGNKVRLFPAPSGVTLRIRYQFRPPPLVLAQGRITGFDDVAVSIDLDELGEDLTTSIAQLKAFVNIIDPVTGLIKATLQVNGIDTDNNTLTFKTAAPDRTTVFGLDVDTALPTSIALDDYVCLASGTCVPTLLGDYYDFVLQHAVVAIRRKTGEPTSEDMAELAQLEKDVLAVRAGRESGRRVTKSNPFWGQSVPLNRRYTT